jgi:hypothetical protein
MSSCSFSVLRCCQAGFYQYFEKMSPAPLFCSDFCSNSPKSIKGNGRPSLKYRQLAVSHCRSAMSFDAKLALFGLP